MTPPLKHHGRMYLEIDHELWARLESLEQLSNQHDILLMSLLSGTSLDEESRLLVKNIIDRLEHMWDEN